MKQTKGQPHSKNKSSKDIATSRSADLFVRVNNWLEKNDKKLFYGIGILCLLYSIMLFNARISEANDDSLYIESAYNYSKRFFSYFYIANAPLYPMMLSLPVAIMGINLIALKILSLLFNFLQLFFFYKAFKNRLPNLVFYPTLFIIAINSLVLYYASMTYSESFFMFLQALFFYYYFKLYDRLEAGETDLKQTYKSWLVIGFLLTLLTFTRSIAIVTLPAVFIMFLLFKQYRYAIYSLGAIIIFKVPMELLKLLIWGKQNQFGSQTRLLLQKDPYDASLGQENFSGFVGRLIDNSQIYLSKRFFQIIGFVSESSTNVNGFVTLVVLVLILLGGIHLLLNKNKKLMITLFYSCAIMISSFIVLQARWDQARIIMVIMPMLCLIIFYGIYQTVLKSSIGQNIYLLLIIITCSSVLISSTKKSNHNLPILKQNMSGDVYFGYTNDWVNYLKMSEWCGTNLSDSSKIACRKGPMSFIYGKGHSFYPVYAVMALDTATKMSNPDSVLTIFKRNKVTHVLVANLRQNPAKANGSIINTMQRILAPVEQKYPQKLKLINTIGATEQADLYEIIY